MDMRDRLAIGLIGAGTLLGALPAGAQDVAPITIVITNRPGSRGLPG
jgi:hypothetical protein